MIPRISHRRFAIAAIALAALAAVASAASPNILRHVIAGGGRRSVGGATSSRAPSDRPSQVRSQAP
ncbi:MAG: hypothetical protein KF705_01185 [Phycisphaeraceae bacterium]|nr:hypothetical protein [Phycisphaeraceae bacterium]